MDRSIEFFGKLESIEEEIKKIIKDDTSDSNTLIVAIEKKREYILKGMKKAIVEEDYSLIVEDIAQYLDIDEKQVRANIIPKLDYIRAPEGAADFFSIEHNMGMSFVEMRIKKWKRLFIRKESFEEFLQRHLVMYCPYTNIRWSEREKKFVVTGMGETPLSFPKNMPIKLIRKCNIGSIIKEKKLEDFIRKTKNDITHARMLGLITAERLQEEMEYLSKNKHNLIIPVHNQEIKNYIEKVPGYRLHLYKEESDKEKPLYTVKRKTENEIRIKPTVLYWFMEKEEFD